MSDTTARDVNAGAGGQDLRKDSGDPNDDRGYLEDQPPAQVDGEAVREHASETSDGPSADDAARD